MASSDGRNQAHLINIQLPAQYGPTRTVETIERYLADVSSLLASPFARALVAQHPNTVAADISGTPPAGIEQLWKWTGQVGHGLDGGELDDKREDTLIRLCRGELDDQASGSLVTFVQALQALALPRQPAKDELPTSLADLQAQRRHHQDIKQRPKKIHEVARMSAEVGKLVQDTGVRRVVDVGAGQGYISRALSLPPYNLHVLALDGASAQTEGAQQILRSVETVPPPASESTGSLIHQTTHIASPSSLVSSISDWIASTSVATSSPSEPEPILLAGLHACGSLTLSILRTFIATANQQELGEAASTWRPTSLLLVGCCYNLLTHSFPLYSLPSPSTPSPTHSESESEDPPTARLTPLACTIIPASLITQDHLQLAAQDPSSWQRIPNSSWRVAVRKIAWRAVVERELALRGATPPEGGWRVGKVGGGQRVWSGEDGWEEYARVVAGRVGVERLGMGEEGDQGMEREERREWEWRLGVVHVFRCLLGPVIETLLLLDRYLLLLTSLPPPSATQPRLTISLKPIFDPATGSLRNMALIVSPAPMPTA